mmetsp:Transcript_19471/g.58825  ORF Transcript_19471/g.58825 Transcript_19471/m.58825 type:complete len:131 (+) Transcript_19471:69-461(+)
MTFRKVLCYWIAHGCSWLSERFRTDFSPAQEPRARVFFPPREASVRYHCSENLARMHCINCLCNGADTLESVRHVLCERQISSQVLIDELGDFGSAFVAAKSGALPSAPGHELEWTRRNFFSGSCNANDA